MPKRWCICPVVGTGTMDDSYRAAVADAGVDHVAVIPTGAGGAPRFGWCLALVSGTATQLAAANALQGVRPLPNIDKDTLLGSAPLAQRQALRAALDERGLTDLQLDTAQAFRVLLRALGRRLDGGFHEDGTDVG